MSFDSMISIIGYTGIPFTNFSFGIHISLLHFPIFSNYLTRAVLGNNSGLSPLLKQSLSRSLGELNLCHFIYPFEIRKLSTLDIFLVFSSKICLWILLSAISYI